MRITPDRSQFPLNRGGSVLIIVLWIAFGLVSLALYFANSMSFELRAADNRVASLEAEQAIAGAARYVSNVLVTVEDPGIFPAVELYRSDALPVGNATFWLIGRDDRQSKPDQPWFSLVDEASKLNLNTVTREMLELLPRMTPELAGAIIDWRDADSDVSANGAESETYQRRTPAYRCKNARFESVEELRLLAGVNLEVLYGEDTNLNGVLDPNEDDGTVSLPIDNRDGRLDSGMLEYFTVFSREPNTRTNGTPRVNVSGSNPQELAALLAEKFEVDRANEILGQFVAPAGGGGGQPGGGGGPGGRGGGAGGGGAGGAGAAITVRSVLEFYLRSTMNEDEFAEIAGDVTVSTNAFAEGLINVNTASQAVLACIPGIGYDHAPSMVAFRQSNPSRLRSLAWVVEVIGQTNAFQAGPYLTSHSYQFTADIAALGHHERGYRRERFVFDASEGAPRIVYRRDATHLGWALGSEIRKTIELTSEGASRTSSRSGGRNL